MNIVPQYLKNKAMRAFSLWLFGFGLCGVACLAFVDNLPDPIFWLAFSCGAGGLIWAWLLKKSE